MIKNLLPLIAILILTLGFVGCKKNKDPKAPVEPSQTMGQMQEEAEDQISFESENDDESEGRDQASFENENDDESEGRDQGNFENENDDEREG